MEADKSEKSDEVADKEAKSVKDLKLTDDNEKDTKKDDQANKSDDDEIDESAHRSKNEQEVRDEATKSADGVEKSEADKSVKKSEYAD